MSMKNSSDTIGKKLWINSEIEVQADVSNRSLLGRTNIFVKYTEVKLICS
jgi:hypothetical protein